MKGCVHVNMVLQILSVFQNNEYHLEAYLKSNLIIKSTPPYHRMGKA